jgi:peptidoglycan DL-endopeptidase CwlO
MTALPRRWTALALAPLVAAGALVLAPAGAASTTPAAAVRKAPVLTAPGGDAPEEGGDQLLSDVLESTGRRYVAAKNSLEKSKKRQLQLTLELQKAEAKRNALLPQVAAVAAQSYRNGPLTGTAFMLQSHDSTNFIERAMSLGEIGELNGHKVAQYQAVADEVERNKAAIDQAVKQADKETQAIRTSQKEAERALALVGGNSLTRGFVDATSRQAAPAPRNSDGGFSPESCSVNDPTTSGCITPRTMHMYKEVKKAGFNRFVGCHRNGGPFEHPKGRACDWSLQTSGFSVAHNADMRKYGNDLMAFLVRNADRLGILYVIWFKQIWFPATGWKIYHGPSAHTDHVHVSML